ncbi:MAG: hypothetical protein C5B58_06270 [Acidobacteria bacterium]|nr:MAG: hypothetical protein C5B58_06270 [Acidobacteriota bacterium]
MLANERQEEIALYVHAEALAHIVMELQRRLFTRLSDGIKYGKISFPQHVVLTYLESSEAVPMSNIATRIGHSGAPCRDSNPARIHGM